MDLGLVILIVASLGLVAVVVLALALQRLFAQLQALRQQVDRSGEPDSGMLVLQNQVEALREQVRASLEGSRLEVDRRLEGTQRLMSDVRRELGEVDQQIRGVTRATSELRGLQDLLRSPTVRGGMGEHLLSELLAQVLPQGHYTLQHEFQGRERVDAVLRVGDGLVPVDSKFPLENFQRMREAQRQQDEGSMRSAERAFRTDVRRHIEAIAKRYIRPSEGTYDFALMYIPSEGVYQEVLRQDGPDGLDLFYHALTRQVVPVSPQSFYAYLQVIIMGMRGLNIEHRAREIMGRVGDCQQRLTGFAESFEIVLRHLGNAQRQSEEASRRLARLDAALARLSEVPAEETPEIVRRPGS